MVAVGYFETAKKSSLLSLSSTIFLPSAVGLFHIKVDPAKLLISCLTAKTAFLRYLGHFYGNKKAPRTCEALAPEAGLEPATL
jgi:hypothetical protein